MLKLEKKSEMFWNIKISTYLKQDISNMVWFEQ